MAQNNNDSKSIDNFLKKIKNIDYKVLDTNVIIVHDDNDGLLSFYYKITKDEKILTICNKQFELIDDTLLNKKNILNPDSEQQFVEIISEYTENKIDLNSIDYSKIIKFFNTDLPLDTNSYSKSEILILLLVDQIEKSENLWIGKKGILNKNVIAAKSYKAVLNDSTIKIIDEIKKTEKIQQNINYWILTLAFFLGAVIIFIIWFSISKFKKKKVPIKTEEVINCLEKIKGLDIKELTEYLKESNINENEIKKFEEKLKKILSRYLYINDNVVNKINNLQEVNNKQNEDILENLVKNHYTKELLQNYISEKIEEPKNIENELFKENEKNEVLEIIGILKKSKIEAISFQQICNILYKENAFDENKINQIKNDLDTLIKSNQIISELNKIYQNKDK